MANYTQNGTYSLPVGGDFSATVDANLTDVVFNLTSTLPSTFTIEANIGSSVTIDATSNVTTVVNVITNGGSITLGTGLVGHLLAVNATITSGGTFATPAALLTQLNGGSITFGAGGGTNVVGTEATPLNLSSSRIVYGFIGSADVFDDKSLTFSEVSSYSVGGTNADGDQTITLQAGDSSLSFITFGANVAPGLYSSTTTGPLLLANDGTGGTDIVAQVVCYVRGTRIATPDGEVAVEALRVGDLVDARFGADAERTAQPVKWLGYRRIDLTAHPCPDTVAPIWVCTGAFADNVPHRDLLLSPDHAIFVDGKLISARQLVNGTTIRQERDRRSVDYFHIELDNHAILLAEGLPAESYLNTGNSGFFANGHDPLVLHPDLTDEADYPTREESSCAPFVWDEASVQPVWQSLADRAAALGQKLPERVTTMDMGLYILANGRVIKPIAATNGTATFVLPRCATEVRLGSRVSTPTDTRPWLDDRRRLGVYVERIMFRDAGDVQELPLDHPGLSQGWWDIERHGGSIRRWTDGSAVLPVPAFERPTILEITASCSGMIYLEDAEEERRVA